MGLPDVTYPTDEEEWAGSLTLPRELTVRGRRLIQKPLPELKKLRGEELSLEEKLNEEQCIRLPDACEIEVDIRPGDCEIGILTDGDGTGGIVISYDDREKEITIDKSGMKERFNTELGESRKRPLPDGLSHLRIFIDRSSVEIFVNDGDAVFTTRAFPTDQEHFMKIKEGDTFMHIWKLKPAVKDNFII